MRIEPAYCSRRGAARGSRHGFTLLELLLVLIILGAMVAMVIPALSEFARGKETINCASQLVSVTNWAHTQAIARGVPYRLNIDPAAGTFWLTVREPAGVDFVAVGEGFGRVFTAPEGITLTWDAPPQLDGEYVEFSPTGRMDPATIRVVGDSKEIDVACLSATETFRIVDGSQNR